jgi:hypothetical protein
MLDKNMFEDGDRLFLEVGFKKNIKIGTYGINWIRTGNFMEFDNPKEFIENEEYLDNIEYLKHHNFMIIKNNN